MLQGTQFALAIAAETPKWIGLSVAGVAADSAPAADSYAIAIESGNAQ
jgi:hypothetical protein